jgi:threonine synthase
MKTASINIQNSIMICPVCGKQYDKNKIQSFATCCNQPLIIEFDFKHETKEDINSDVPSMWRYQRFLPFVEEQNIVTLGEGFTPLHSFEKLSEQLQVNLIWKDEGVNPTGSFKARGISMAVSKAKQFGVDHCIMPTAGNAGGALSAYCAKAGMKATVIMPEHTASLLKEECKAYGAEVITIKGLINDCGVLAKEISAKTGAFDMSTLKEPYRLEGKKTMGYEIAEQLLWEVPDVIMYPTGGGTGLLGIWKAMEEMKSMKWIGGKMPRMVAVQSENCQPMVVMFHKGKIPDNYKATASIALGLAVPYPFAKDQIQQILHKSNGTAIAIADLEIREEILKVARTEGVLLSAEGASCVSATRKLLANDWIKKEETVLILNTGNWYKYH